MTPYQPTFTNTRKTNVTREELLSSVPVHWHRGKPYFVRLAEIPEPWRTDFSGWLRGQSCPVLPGESSPLAFVWDLKSWALGNAPGEC